MAELKQKKCKQCGNKYTPISSLSRVCSMACALDDVAGKKQAEFKAETVKRKREFLAKDTPFQKAKAQKSFNEFIRLRDAKFGCISCDKPFDWHGKWNAGHFKTVGARPDLRFNEDNCHKQCEQCNSFLSGNVAVYRLMLVAKIGEYRVNALDVVSTKKYRCDDYIAIHEQYQKKIKALKSEL